MEKSRTPLHVTDGYKGKNLPTSTYGAYPVRYSLVKDIYKDMDNMDKDIEKAINSTSTKVKQLEHEFEVLQPIYFNITQKKWVLAQADDSDTIGTHVVVEVVDKNYFVAGLDGIYNIKNALDAGYYFTSDTEAGELVDTPPDINNPVLQVLDSNTIRVLDVGIIIDSLEIPALAEESSYDAATLAYLNSLFESLSDSIKENFLRVWGRLGKAEGLSKLFELEISEPIEFIDILDLDISESIKIVYNTTRPINGILHNNGVQINGIIDFVYGTTNFSRNYIPIYAGRYYTVGQIIVDILGGSPFYKTSFNTGYGAVDTTPIITQRSINGIIDSNVDNIFSIRILTTGLDIGSKIVVYGK